MAQKSDLNLISCVTGPILVSVKLQPYILQMQVEAYICSCPRIMLKIFMAGVAMLSSTQPFFQTALFLCDLILNLVEFVLQLIIHA